MLNPIINTEALNSATYVDNYIDSVENLPDDVQRRLSRIRDIDVQYRTYLRDVDHYYDLWKSLTQIADETVAVRKARAITRMHQSLIQAQELGDEKLQIVSQLQEIIDCKTRQLDTDQKNLDIREDMQQQQRVEQLQQSALEDCGAPTSAKHSRTQSPNRGSSSASGGGSTPNSERSGHVSNVGQAASILGGIGSANGTTTNSGVGGVVNVGAAGGGPLSSSAFSSGNDLQRSATKRSRRRNENGTNNSNSMVSLEMGGNESNSANEGNGSNGADRQLAQKATIGGGSATAQKKNAMQNQASVQATGQGVGVGSGVGGVGANASVGAAVGGNNTGKKRKRKARNTQSTSVAASTREETPPPEIDPDEPTYCICNQISFGEMILCDNDLCPIEWFHFSCVSLVLKPKGRWYCPNCRGERPNVMKPKAQFLKELERYNKEKEEKT